MSRAGDEPPRMSGSLEGRIPLPDFTSAVRHIERRTACWCCTETLEERIYLDRGQGSLRCYRGAWTPCPRSKPCIACSTGIRERFALDPPDSRNRKPGRCWRSGNSDGRHSPARRIQQACARACPRSVVVSPEFTAPAQVARAEPGSVGRAPRRTQFAVARVVFDSVPSAPIWKRVRRFCFCPARLLGPSGLTGAAALKANRSLTTVANRAGSPSDSVGRLPYWRQIERRPPADAGRANVLTVSNAARRRAVDRTRGTLRHSLTHRAQDNRPHQLRYWTIA